MVVDESGDMVQVGGIVAHPWAIPVAQTPEEMTLGKPHVIHQGLKEAQETLRKFAHSTAPAVVVTRARCPERRV